MITRCKLYAITSFRFNRYFRKYRIYFAGGNNGGNVSNASHHHKISRSLDLYRLHMVSFSLSVLALELCDTTWDIQVRISNSGIWGSSKLSHDWMDDKTTFTGGKPGLAVCFSIFYMLHLS